MIEHPGPAVIAAAIAIAVSLTTRTRPLRWYLWGSALILIGSWIPILSDRWMGGDSGIGPGLLAWIGSDFGLIVLAAGILWRLALVLRHKT